MGFDADSIKRDLEKLSSQTAWAFYRLIVSNLPPASLEQEEHSLESQHPFGSRPQ